MTIVRSEQRSYSADASNVSAARGFVTARLEAWQLDGLVWTAQLALSELATNCVLHAGTPFTVRVRHLADGAVRLEVDDGVRRAPRQRSYDLSSTTGRGIVLVAGLARAWGVEQRPGGKTVWCEIVAAPEQGDETGRSEVDLDAFLDEADREPLSEARPGPAVR